MAVASILDAMDKEAFEAFDIGEVLRREFAAVHDTQWKPLPAAEAKKLRRALAAPSRSEFGRALRIASYQWNVHRLPDSGQTALCLSGGGIRSAAFNLGVLQALAGRKLLSRTNYLSTVSGGGYIGAWLTAWAHRARLANPGGSFTEVEEQLGKQRRPAEGEPAPLARLRFNQKFLTPRAGLGSPDTWAFAFAFLRDLLINWLVFGPLLMAFVCGPQILLRLLAWSRDAGFCGLDTGALVRCGSSLVWLANAALAAADGLAAMVGLGGWVPASLGEAGEVPWPPWHGWPAWLDSLGAVCAVFGMAMAMRNRPALGRSTISDVGFLWQVLVPVLLGATLLLAASASWYAAAPVTPAAFVQWVCLVPAGYLIARLAVARGGIVDPGGARQPWYWNLLRSLWHVVVLAVCGAATGALIGWGLHLAGAWAAAPSTAPPSDLDTLRTHFAAAGTVVQDAHQYRFSRALAVFGVPWLLAAFAAGQVLYAAITSFLATGRQDREWMARASGWYLATAAVWLVVDATVLYGPDALLQGYELAVAAAGSLLSGTLAAGLASGARSLAGMPRNGAGRLRAVAVPCAALLFAMAVIVMLARLAADLVRLAYPAIAPRLPWAGTVPAQEFGVWAVVAVLLVLASLAVSCFANVNIFSLHGLYRNRLARTFIGASNTEAVTKKKDSDRNEFDGFAPSDTIGMGKLWRDGDGNPDPARRGPFPVVNMAVNLLHAQDRAWQDRKAASFFATPLHAGGDAVAFRDVRLVASDMGWITRRALEKATDGERRRLLHAADGLWLGTAMAVSGAAANPNAGYHSSSLSAFVMMLFNVRLGWWLGNPRGARKPHRWFVPVWRWYRLLWPAWMRSGPRFNSLKLLAQELFGLTGTDSSHVFLSDGGHFDNLGLYEMLRRRCRLIVVSDATADGDCNLDDLGRSLRLAAVDLGVTVEFGPLGFRRRGSLDLGGAYCAVGRIYYPERRNEPDYGKARLIYIKPGVFRDAPASVRAHANCHPHFPHDSTTNQWFTEAQFESYRALGSHAIRRICGPRLPDTTPADYGRFLQAAEQHAARALAALTDPHRVTLVP